MRAFLICPVRNPDIRTDEVVDNLEGQGWQVHYPPRDTNQDDPTGYRICQDNRAAIMAADRVFVFWDGKSQGSLFDLGIAFALGKPITVLYTPDPTEGKSFQNMMREWETYE